MPTKWPFHASFEYAALILLHCPPDMVEMWSPEQVTAAHLCRMGKSTLRRAPFNATAAVFSVGNDSSAPQLGDNQSCGLRYSCEPKKHERSSATGREIQFCNIGLTSVIEDLRGKGKPERTSEIHTWSRTLCMVSPL